MVISRTRLAVMMGIACFCFGCKGAGGLLHVLGAVAVTAVRVAAVAAVAAPHHGSSEGGYQGEVDAPEGPVQVAYIAPSPDPAPPPVGSVHPRCIELDPAPELPGDSFAVRTVACGGRVMVQDAQTGMWRTHR